MKVVALFRDPWGGERVKTANSEGLWTYPSLLSGSLQSLQKKVLCRESGWEDVGVFESPGVGVGVGGPYSKLLFGPRVVSS